MYDLIVVGAGPGGSSVSTYLAQAGYKVLIIEKEKFPRFHIGESLLPYSMEIFQELGFYEKLCSGKYLRKNGAYFFDIELDKGAYFDFSNKGKAKFPHAFEVQRSEFDKDFLDFAIESGVEVKQPETYLDCELFDDHISVKTDNGTYQARYIVDASGQGSIVSRKFQDKETNDVYNNNFAFYAHFEDIDRSHQRDEGDISVGILRNKAWSWMIPFKDGTTSVGIVAQKDQIKELKKSEVFFNETLNENSWFKKLMTGSKRIGDFKVSSNYSYKSGSLCGERWASVGDAMSFLDPVFSSGVHLSLVSSKYLAKNIINSLQNDSLALNSKDNTYDYEDMVLKGINRFHNLLQMFYNGGFIKRVQDLESKPRVMCDMTTAVAGGMWEDNNTLFRMGVL